MQEIRDAQTDPIEKLTNPGRKLRHNRPRNNSPTSSTILFIDPAFDGYQSLINSANPETEVVVLDPRLDSVEQITQALAGRTGITRLHIACHGDPGSLELGFRHLGLGELAHKRVMTCLQQWRQALNADSELLLHACQVAAGPMGKAFVQRLQQLTGAKIASGPLTSGVAK
ncbi:DUF4347 domain-containing protein [Lyngbya aestuarii]|uniref:DUF4347 domain-containing protein n=1 Tax=Lyngbya aestuarii TaxID=118322 RepID=UPI00403E0A61